MKGKRSKQETIEEAAERFILEYVGDEMSREDKRLYAILKGVTSKLIKWQAERMYSEEEVLEILDKFLTSMVKGEKTGLIEQWFNQFKKK